MRSNRRFLCTCALAILATMSTAMPAAGRPGPGDTPSPVALSNIRIDNFGRVNANYYRGEQPEGRDYADLAALGIKTVIDLQADGTNYNERRLVEAAGMKFYRIPMTTHVPPTPSQLALFLQIVNDSAQQPVYVHCKGGKHRTGVMTAVYRMEQDGWSRDQAFREMKRYKFGLDFLHPEFKQFVYSYRPRLAATPESVEVMKAAN